MITKFLSSWETNTNFELLSSSFFEETDLTQILQICLQGVTVFLNSSNFWELCEQPRSSALKISHWQTRAERKKTNHLSLYKAVSPNEKPAIFFCATWSLLNFCSSRLHSQAAQLLRQEVRGKLSKCRGRYGNWAAAERRKLRRNAIGRQTASEYWVTTMIKTKWRCKCESHEHQKRLTFVFSANFKATAEKDSSNCENIRVTERTRKPTITVLHGQFKSKETLQIR